MNNPQNLKPWKPGQSGNPLGRPVGSRTAFSEAFFRDVAFVWAERGRAAIEHTATKNPEVFLGVCSRLIPKDVTLTVEQQNPGNLSNEDWALFREIMDAVRTLVPDANSRQPNEVFQTLRDAIELYTASIVKK
jgi:hypothetical protein